MFKFRTFVPIATACATIFATVSVAQAEMMKAKAIFAVVGNHTGDDSYWQVKKHTQFSVEKNNLSVDIEVGEDWMRVGGVTYVQGNNDLSEITTMLDLPALGADTELFPLVPEFAGNAFLDVLGTTDDIVKADWFTTAENELTQASFILPLGSYFIQLSYVVLADSPGLGSYVQNLQINLYETEEPLFVPPLDEEEWDDRDPDEPDGYDFDLPETSQGLNLSQEDAKAVGLDLTDLGQPTGSTGGGETGTSEEGMNSSGLEGTEGGLDLIEQDSEELGLDNLEQFAGVETDALGGEWNSSDLEEVEYGLEFSRQDARVVGLNARELRAPGASNSE